MPLNCLIVDDEPLSQDVIVDFVHASPELNLVAVCSDSMEAGEILKNEKDTREIHQRKERHGKQEPCKKAS